MVKPVATVHVVPNLPAPLTRLRELAYNLRWSWDHDSIGLFRRMDRDLWETTGHNPVWMLGLIDQRRLEALCEDPAFMAQFYRVCNGFDATCRRSKRGMNTITARSISLSSPTFRWNSG